MASKLRSFKGPAVRAAREAWLQGAIYAVKLHNVLRRPDVSSTEPDIRFLIREGYGRGGNARSVITLANFLSRHYQVEIASVVCHADEPFFPVAPAVGVTPLVDVRSQVPQKIAARHRPDIRLYRAAVGHGRVLAETVATLHWLVSLRGGVLITARADLTLLAARVVSPEVIIVAQEHSPLGRKRPGTPAAMKRGYVRVDATVTFTLAEQREYEALLHGVTEVRCIANPVPMPDLPAPPLDATRIVAAGRLAPQKGFDLLVEAFEPLARRHPEWILQIFGGGPLHDVLAEQVNRAGLNRNVLLSGATRNLEAELARASIFVLSSRWEGFGLVIVEAMSVGLPVVSFDCPHGPSEIITHGHDGLLVPPQDVPGLTSALERLMLDRSLRRQMGASARNNAHRYDVERIGPEWLSLLAELRARRA